MMNRSKDHDLLARVDKQYFSIVDAGEHEDDLAYWLTQTPEARIRAMEIIRNILYGKIKSSKRFSRFFEIAE